MPAPSLGVPVLAPTQACEATTLLLCPSSGARREGSSLAVNSPPAQGSGLLLRGPLAARTKELQTCARSWGNHAASSCAKPRSSRDRRPTAALRVTGRGRENSGEAVEANNIFI